MSIPCVHGGRRRQADVFPQATATQRRSVAETARTPDERSARPVVERPVCDRLSARTDFSCRTAEVADDDRGTAPVKAQRIAKGLPGRGRSGERAFPGAAPRV